MITVWVVIGILVLVIVVVVYHQSSGGWRPPTINAPMVSQLRLPGDVRQRIDVLLDQGKKIEAIREVRAATGVGLKEAKDYVEDVRAGVRAVSTAADYAQPIAAGIITLSQDVEHTVRREIAAGNKIMAIKLVREATDAGLKQAKDFVEAMAVSIIPADVAVDDAHPIASGVIALSPDIEREVRCVLTAGNKITAIRIVREASGAGLKAAKDFVDRM
ncbi:MAG: ribosomal protein L7/L12 [Herpetosiphonaceae bacterium]|nr:ribosomal protein L7/L12 [Herpetosiphonaceae bacterium]